MTRDELRSVLKQAVVLLGVNKETCDTEVLQNLDKAVTQLSEPAMLMILKPILGENIEKTIASLRKLVDMEKDMLIVKPGKRQCTSDSLVQGLERLQNRPLILSMIAAAL